ncbi:hypothetical protein BJ166DRAFT_94476 [Pestalotiopsis sp. NC0098]|nr:hypothetical protein BJ166DRAFT_94476 [Pestalotiopsis sp. NC0098]
MTSETFDFVVVGGGLSGLVVASRLSEDPATSVLVIESGKDLTNDHRVKIPAFWGMLLDDPDATWQLKTAPQEALGGREIMLSQGRMLGGSSALNGLSFSATSKANVNAWASLGNPGWDWDSFSAAMKKSYESGPLDVAGPGEESGWPKAWRETLSSLGYSASNDPFSGQVCGTLTVPDAINPSTRERSFSGNAYLGSAAQRSNLTIWTQTTVDKILFGDDDGSSLGRSATGVQCTTVSGETKTAKVGKEVILTAGTLNSPRVLELSGIGDKARLEKLGIDVIIDNSFVGENLQNHPMVGVNYEVLGGEEGFETADKLARQEPAAVAAAMEDYTARQRGPFSKSGANYAAHLPFPGIVDGTGKDKVEDILKIPALVEGGAAKTTPEFAEAHKSFVGSVLQSPKEASGCYLSAAAFASFNADGSRASVTQFSGDASYFTIVLLLAHPLSRGSVHIKSAAAAKSDAPDQLVLDPRYLTHPADIEVLASHLQYAATIAATEPLASHLKPDGKHNPGAPEVGSFNDIENVKKYIYETAVGAQHWTGTCSMMAKELGGVVDPELRLYGSSNLRVCDASVIPITPRTNPQATVYGIAEHAADMIKTKHGTKK